MKKLTKIKIARPIPLDARPRAEISPVPRLARRALICVWTADPETGRLICSWTRPMDGDRACVSDPAEPPSTLRIAA